MIGSKKDCFKGIRNIIRIMKAGLCLGGIRQ